MMAIAGAIVIGAMARKGVMVSSPGAARAAAQVVWTEARADTRR